MNLQFFVIHERKVQYLVCQMHDTSTASLGLSAELRQPVLLLWSPSCVRRKVHAAHFQTALWLAVRGATNGWNRNPGASQSRT
eukprot:6028512-Amphidinium_carterae.1